MGPGRGKELLLAFLGGGQQWSEFGKAAKLGQQRAVVRDGLADHRQLMLGRWERQVNWGSARATGK